MNTLKYLNEQIIDKKSQRNRKAKEIYLLNMNKIRPNYIEEMKNLNEIY